MPGRGANGSRIKTGRLQHCLDFKEFLTADFWLDTAVFLLGKNAEHHIEQAVEIFNGMVTSGFTPAIAYFVFF